MIIWENDFYDIWNIWKPLFFYISIRKFLETLFYQKPFINGCCYPYTKKNSSRNFTQLLSKVGTNGQVGVYLILLG